MLDLDAEVELAVLDQMAARLEKVRKEEGLSQEAFATRLGISRGAYQHYSKAGREIPSSVLDALLEEFQIDPYWMLRGDDEKGGTKIERQLVANATTVALTLRDTYEKLGISRDHDKMVAATQFSCFHLFDKRKPLSEGDLKVVQNLAEA